MGFLCVLWFTALHYIQEEVGKETGSLFSGIIAEFGLVLLIIWIPREKMWPLPVEQRRMLATLSLFILQDGTGD